MRTTTLVLGVVACGDSGGVTTEATSTPSTSGASAETGTGGTTETGGGPTTTGEPTTGVTGGSTESGTTSATGETTVGTTTGPGTGTSATTDGMESSGDSGGSSVGSTSDGGGDFIPCESDQDCSLADGCCECNPIGPGEKPQPCDVECIQSMCSAHGLEGAAVECRFGRCTFAKIQCNPLGVDCNIPQPECPAGEVASVEDTNNGRCWTGSCVFAEACDWVPDCSYCDTSELVCVGKLQKGAYHVCEPKPVDCGDVDDIDCGCGQQICDASPPHTVCGDAADDIDCECPFC